MSLPELVDLVRRGSDFLLVPHRRPDADALGSALGLAAVLRAYGKRATVYVPGEIPRSLTFLAPADETVQTLASDARFDATFVLDTASPELLPPDLLGDPRMGRWVVLDHHATHTDFGDIVVRRVGASATAELVVAVARELGLQDLPAEAATPLYAALSADTGGFRYPGTTSTTMRLGADLLDAGAEAWPVAQHLFEAWPLGRLRLLGALIDGLELDFVGKLAILRVTRDMMRRAGADDDMVDGLVNYGRMIEGVVISALVWEWPPEQGAPASKISMRSNGSVDVSQVALAFGGGGHRAAAGALARMPLEDTISRIRAEVAPLLP